MQIKGKHNPSKPINVDGFDKSRLYNVVTDIVEQFACTKIEDM